MIRVVKKTTIFALVFLALFITDSAISNGTDMDDENATTVEFTDVTDDYWGKEGIDFAAEKGIINGYEEADGTRTFKPESTVTKEEAATMICKTLASAGEMDESQDYTEKYTADFDTYNVPDWSRPFLAYVIEKGIMKQDGLENVVNEKGLGIPAKRIEIALWSENILKGRHSDVFVLPYNDFDNIIEKAEIDALYRYGIMKGSKNLDDSISFNADSNVKRSEFAAICQRVYNKIKDYDRENYSLDEELINWHGEIVNIDDKSCQIDIKNPDDEKIYKVAFPEEFNLKIDKNDNIYTKNKLREYLSLSGSELLGRNITIASMPLNENFYIREDKIAGINQIIIATKPLVLTGEIVAVENMSDDVTFVGIDVKKDEYSDNQIEINYYLVDENLLYEENLYSGDSVKFILDGNRIIEIKGNSI